MSAPQGPLTQQQQQLQDLVREIKAEGDLLPAHLPHRDHISNQFHAIRNSCFDYTHQKAVDELTHFREQVLWPALRAAQIPLSASASQSPGPAASQALQPATSQALQLASYAAALPAHVLAHAHPLTDGLAVDNRSFQRMLQERTPATRQEQARYQDQRDLFLQVAMALKPEALPLMRHMGDNFRQFETGYTKLLNKHKVALQHLEKLAGTWREMTELLSALHRVA